MSVWPVASQTSHQQEPGSSPLQHDIENAAQRLGIDVAVHADTTAPTQINHHIAALPAGLRWGGLWRGDQDETAATI
ncbi:hypothetical protein [Mesorhizobium sp.]|uniref:hypothetical protein n=1 Tax=Mesorhizobium sp. TaxID=1871066 RepID=UPI00338E33EC